MRIIALLALILPFLSQPCYAQTFGGLGSRAEGMGGAFVAVADDASAVYWNPAGLAWPTGATFDAQLFTGRSPSAAIGTASSTFFAAAMPVLGVSFYHARQPHAGVPGLPTVSDSDDRQNGGSGEVQLRSIGTTNFGVTVLQSIVNRVVIGTTVRVVSGGIEDFEGRTTIDLDAGAMFSAGPVRLGITGRNLRELRFQADGEPIPLKRQVRLGAAWAPRSAVHGVHGPFSLAFDVDLTTTPGPAGDMREAAAGGEYWIAEGRVGGRAGVRWNVADWNDPAISAGVTVKIPGGMAFPVFAEGHVTKRHEVSQLSWGAGARVTF